MHLFLNYNSSVESYAIMIVIIITTDLYSAKLPKVARPFMEKDKFKLWGQIGFGMRPF